MNHPSLNQISPPLQQLQRLQQANDKESAVLESMQVRIRHSNTMIYFIIDTNHLLSDLKSSASKGELGVVLPNKPGDKLTHPKRPTMAGRKKPTKNAIQNKKEMELRSQEAKAAAGGAAKDNKPRMSQSVGGLNLLAHLVVNKPLNGSPSRNSVALSPANSASSLTDSASSSSYDLMAKGLGGSLTTGNASSVAAIPSNVDFKQLLDPGGPKLLQIKGRR